MEEFIRGVRVYIVDYPSLLTTTKISEKQIILHQKFEKILNEFNAKHRTNKNE